ncbi:hypothetical protein GT755_03055 [Herbidospora sp. NEAU-GS84]|uniref:Uncharacterized protein n=1 Tax=Herbidospora solisilvae TaxID=2696284 RepID=A0A7C9JA55_9ACTN|nr:hypothetical protein [Herbidospora solisilvae]NAS20661.1 hypothetical protein [Herbidospora solisilvae]
MVEKRGIDGESEVVAQRSGADTQTPDHPILRDLEPVEEADDVAGSEESDMPEPDPEVGPAS